MSPTPHGTVVVWQTGVSVIHADIGPHGRVVAGYATETLEFA